MHRLSWWWTKPGSDERIHFNEMDSPSRDYAIGLFAEELMDSFTFETSANGKLLTSLVLKNYADLVVSERLYFHVRLD